MRRCGAATRRHSLLNDSSHSWISAVGTVRIWHQERQAFLKASSGAAPSDSTKSLMAGAGRRKIGSATLSCQPSGRTPNPMNSSCGVGPWKKTASKRSGLSKMTFSQCGLASACPENAQHIRAKIRKSSSILRSEPCKRAGSSHRNGCCLQCSMATPAHPEFSGSGVVLHAGRWVPSLSTKGNWPALRLATQVFFVANVSSPDCVMRQFSSAARFFNHKLHSDQRVYQAAQNGAFQM